MKVTLTKAFVLLAVSISISISIFGCAVFKPPLEREKDYPATWPDISSVGVECLDLNGTYSNEGVIGGVDIDNEKNSILLTKLLSGAVGNQDAETISLKVHTKEVRPDGDSFAYLEIMLDDQPQKFVAVNCACTDQTFFYAEDSGGWLIPYYAAGGGGKAVYFTKATDGSLIAKAWGHDWALIVVVPYFHQDYIWARFRPIVD